MVPVPHWGQRSTNQNMSAQRKFNRRIEKALKHPPMYGSNYMRKGLDTGRVVRMSDRWYAVMLDGSWRRI